jgi:ABC-2 type transport system permease protein
MNAFAVHFAFEFKTGLRNASLLLMNYLFPLGFYVMMGVIMAQIDPTFRDLMIPAMVVIAGMSSMILGLPSPLVELREAGVFRSFKINGVPAASILVIPALTAMIHTLIVSAIITLTAPLLFKGAAPTSWLAFVFLTLAVVFTYGAIGMLIGVVSSSSRETVLYSQLIFIPSMLLSGMMMPLSFIPASIQPFTGLLPTTHMIQAFSGWAFGLETVFNPLTSTVIFLSSGILAFVLAIYLFNWDSKNKTRRGHPAMALIALVPYIVGIFIS